MSVREAAANHRVHPVNPGGFPYGRHKAGRSLIYKHNS
jgi:hypothetical protein